MKISRLPRLVAFLSLATAGLVGCAGDNAAPSSAAEVRARIDRLVPRYTLAEARIEDALPATDAALIGRLAQPQPWRPSDPSVSSLETSADLPLHLIRFWSGNSNVQAASAPSRDPIHAVTPPQLPPLQRAPDDAAAWLNGNVFTDANDAGGGEFRIPTGAWCGADAACAKRFGELRMGIIATPIGDDGLELDLVTGENRDVAASFVLTPDGADVSYDLAVAQGILAAHAGVREASGVIDFHIRGWGDNAVAHFDVREPIHVVVDGADSASDVLKLDLGAGEHVLDAGGGIRGPHLGKTPAK